MPFKSKKQRRWMYANKPEMAKRWEEHTPKDEELPEESDKESASKSDLVKAALNMLQRIGSGTTGLAAEITPESWSRKLRQLQARAAAGDETAGDILSMLGVASMVTGAGAGLGVSRLLGSESAGGQALGAGLGTALGAAPGLLPSSADVDEEVLVPGFGGTGPDVLEQAKPKMKELK